MSRITIFQKKVYSIVKKIPKGKTTTYKAIAEQLKTSPRAIGQALKRNPFAPKVPCHRVINSDKSLGGYAGKNYKSKAKLLKKEGLKIIHKKGEIFVR
ncbi:MAG: MGMT family protein [Nanoarchaeota archaeon]|nr:MGMT family protein [Nanoarchaeota archaeon]